MVGLVTSEQYNRLDPFTKDLVDSINTTLNKKETRMNLLWCGTNEIHPIVRGFFCNDTIESLKSENPKLHALINTEHETDGEYANAAADFYKALEDLAYDYDGVILPVHNQIFLSHFFYHAGIEMHSSKPTVKCFVTNDYTTFSPITVLV